MSEVVNLRLVRKARARKAAEDGAAANRALHGRTKAEKARDLHEAERLAAAVDGAKREPR